MTRAILTLALCLCATIGGSAERLPADCRWAIQLDVQKALASQLSAVLNIKSQLKQADAAKLRMLEALTGFDPWRDLRTVTICGVDAGGDSGAILLRGTFHADKLVTLAQAAEGYAAVAAGARTIHTWKQGDKPAAACLVQPDLLVIAKSSERILAVIVAVDASEPPRAGVILPTTSKGILLAAGAADQLGSLIPDGPQAELMRSTHGMSATLSETGSALVFEANAVAADDAQAQQLVDAGRGLIALSQLTKMDGVDPALVAALRGARLERANSALTLRLSLPIADIQRLVAQQQKALLER